jgi:intracellular sulfur oxidation DsrE/DsrF family protein
MKKNILLISSLFFVAHFLQAQPNYKVVFDLTSKDTSDHKNVIRWLKEISESTPDAKLEVVMYAQGLSLVTKGKSQYEDAVTKLAKNKNISFRVCRIAMKNQNIDMSQLLPGVETVPDGIYEIISKQREGWGYIKTAH